MSTAIKRFAVVVAVAVAVLASASSARADGVLHRLADEIHARLAGPAAPQAPQLVPPVPIVVRWKAQRVGSLDLGAPLVALAAADLDGDGKGELYAVTSREVIAIGIVDHRLHELGRVAFGGEAATQAPRDVVGTAVVDGGALVASVSSWTHGLRVTWRAKLLVADRGEPGFVLCPGERAQLAPGRNYFGAATLGVRCRNDLVDPTGHPLHVRAELTTAGRLGIVVERCELGGASCREAGRFEYTKVGVAFELADVDRDGRPEVIFAGAGAPGDPDELKVVTLGDDEKRPKLRKLFTAGGVAGIAVTDIDGDGAPDVFAAVRLVGATRVDLWRLN